MKIIYRIFRNRFFLFINKANIHYHSTIFENKNTEVPTFFIICIKSLVIIFNKNDTFLSVVMK